MPLIARRVSLRLGLLLLAALAYAALSHALMLHAGDRPWAVAVLLGPALLTVLAIALSRRHFPAVACTLGALAALVVLVAAGAISEPSRLYLAQHVGIHLALGASFAFTLRRGGQPAISAIATRVHGRLPAPMQDYTRRVTVLWTGYFFGMAALSVWIHGSLSWSSWSLYANLITPLCIGTLFIGEFLVRYLLHPEFERSSLIDTLRACGAAPSSASQSPELQSR